MTFQIIIGRFGGFYARINGLFSWRICLGWIALTLYPYDMDLPLSKLLDHHDRSREVVFAWHQLSANMRDAEEHLIDNGSGDVHDDFARMDTAMEKLEGTMK